VNEHVHVHVGFELLTCTINMARLWYSVIGGGLGDVSEPMLSM
jgi:hypothetical protein